MRCRHLALAVLAVGVVLLSGCAPEAVSTETPLHETQTPKPEVTESPSANGMSQEVIAKYEKMIQNGEFYSLPKQEQLTYWTQLASGTGDVIGIVQFSNDYALTSEKKTEAFVKPSLDNSPSQVQAIAGNAIRFSLSLDPKSADSKAALFAVIKDNSPTGPAYSTFEDYRANFPGAMSGRVQGSKAVLENTPIIDEANTKVQYDAANEPYMDIRTQSPQGEKTTRYYYIELPDSQIDGLDAMWINH